MIFRVSDVSLPPPNFVIHSYSQQLQGLGHVGEGGPDLLPIHRKIPLKKMAPKSGSASREPLGSEP